LTNGRLLRLFPFELDRRAAGRQGSALDLIAGITVALVLVPQSMAYAQLAGLPAYYGLYAAFLPPLVAALFGSSRQLATGPVAVVSLLTAQHSNQRLGSRLVAHPLSLIVGLFQLGLGVAARRGGELPVASGDHRLHQPPIIIATSQLDKIFGVRATRLPLRNRVNTCAVPRRSTGPRSSLLWAPSPS
jgi:hypothetical protein